MIFEHLRIFAVSNIADSVRALSLGLLGLYVGAASAQSGPPPITAAPGATESAVTGVDPHARWTQSLGEPSIYVNYARADVARGHYKSAARNLRRAAADLKQRSEQVYGRDRKRLVQDVRALRLTATDVAAGAVTSQAQLDSVLDTTHADQVAGAVGR